jgi:DNA polymerase-1
LKLRNSGKTFNFGIPYGMTHIGLAERLDIDKKKAEEMLKDYYKAFPNLKKFFEESEEFGIEHNYIVGAPPTKRIRFFHPPAHKGEKGAIGRQAKNFPIQEGNGSMLKIALVRLRKYLKEHKFPAKLHLPVHDEILSSCHKSVTDEWKILQEKAMEEAADMFLEPGLLKVDTKILNRWKK